MTGYEVRAGEVVVWCVHLPSLPDGLTHHLDSDELERALRFVHTRDRELFTAAHGLLRQILGRCLGVFGREIQFAHAKSGKPHLAGRPAGRLEFNMSHSGDYAVVAVTRELRVGVDMELIRPMEHEAIIARLATDRERRSFTDAAGDRLTVFYQWWTRKEACVKAWGVGLGSEMAEVEVDAAADVQCVQTGSTTWTVAGIPAPPGYAAAVCVEGDRLRLRWPQS